MNKVVFVGAGPGDPDLITVKGSKYLSQADLVIYAGSLVNPDLLDLCKEGAEIYNSATMHLEEMVDLMATAIREGRRVVRLHTGDPSIYGSIREQAEELAKEGIGYEVVPGVSSFLAAAASLGAEYTVPEISQTVILTRMAGRTPVPDGESIRDLASHQASMAIFLSIGMVEDLVQELVAGGYDKETPAAVVYKASWPEEKVIQGTLEDLADKVREAAIKKTALVLVGDFLGDEFNYSYLYSKDFNHEYRP